MTVRSEMQNTINLLLTAIGLCAIVVFVLQHNIIILNHHEHFSPHNLISDLKQGVPQSVLEETDIIFRPLFSADPHYGQPISKREGIWNITCTSEESKRNCSYLIHGDEDEYWQSSPLSFPQNITINLNAVQNISGISVAPVSARGPFIGGIASHRVFLSQDGKDWGEPVAYGTWFEDETEKFANFELKQARFVRLEALTPSIGSTFVRLNDFKVWANETLNSVPHGLGKWGVTINFPLVPVGIFTDPLSGKIITFSSFSHETFDIDKFKKTLTSTWDPATKSVTSRMIESTEHDMFCPGMAYDVNGNMVISGGDTSFQTSIFNPSKAAIDHDGWVKGNLLNIPRGYQGSATLADGRIFVIGGSFVAGNLRDSPKDGEIFSPRTGWTKLPGCKAAPLETKDWRGRYRSDNHVWLLSWKNNSIFQAGPSQEMHWIGVDGQGSITGVGHRKTDRLEDKDAMCGSSVMFDAEKGRVLTAGGASSYDYLDDAGNPRGEPATNNAFVMKLGAVGQRPDIQLAGQGMLFTRIFHNAVILPNGEVLIVGGVDKGTPFHEEGPRLVPEIYNPDSNSWRAVAPLSTIRAYHSFGLLLADATVLVGGGGLCFDVKCKVNHFDAQIYTPQYLLTADGRPAKRPVVFRISSLSVFPGEKILLLADSDIVTASLVRYGGATHTVNNDQRRINLNVTATPKRRQYQVQVPPDGGVAIPGYWMLFVMNADGVPSVAKSIQIKIALN